MITIKPIVRYGDLTIHPEFYLYGQTCPNTGDFAAIPDPYLQQLRNRCPDFPSKVVFVIEAVAHIYQITSEALIVTFRAVEDASNIDNNSQS